jgi:WD40 repeat protein
MGIYLVVSAAWLLLLLLHGCFRPEYVTVSTDGSVRIWDATTHQQLFEFGRGSHSLGSSSSAAPCRASCAAFSPTGYQLAVGFNEGMVRLFDIATSQLLQVG